MKSEKKRQATYTINVPLQITFAADCDITEEELYSTAEKEVYKRLASGYFDVLTAKIDVVSKLPHRTRQEILAEKKAWEEFFSFCGVRGLKKR